MAEMNELRVQKTQRMHALYESEKRKRENAKRVIGSDEPRPKGPSVRDPKTGRWSYYIESSTAAALRRIFEEGEHPFW